MTREEQVVKASKDSEKQMGLPEGISSYGIGFIDGALWADEHPTEEVQRLKEMFKGDPDAYKQGRKDATTRAIEFIYAQQLAVPNIEGLINELKKYMEEQQ